MKSLDQLQETLQPVEQPVTPTVPKNDNPKLADASLTDPFDLSSFEQAAADIEQFMQTRQQEERE